MLNKLFKENEDKMTKTISAFEKEIGKVRTGRASTSMLDGVKVDYYGTLTQLNQMSSISVPESKLIVIQPWDQTIIKEIEKAILKSNLGFTPSNDGKIIRISIPPLTEERRKEIVKQVAQTAEDYKVAIRNIRRESNDAIKKLKQDNEISEDESFKSQDEIQNETNNYIKKIDEKYEAKKKEILEI